MYLIFLKIYSDAKIFLSNLYDSLHAFSVGIEIRRIFYSMC